jgi:nitrite reductase/ring-hydroxylating ferredoxin subunit
MKSQALVLSNTNGNGRRMSIMMSIVCLALVLVQMNVHAFSFLVMMGQRRGKGNLKQALSGETMKLSGVGSLNKGRGQEITGVTLPAENSIKGWEFGERKRMACCNFQGRYYAIQGDCPRCGFDLWKGTLLTDPDVWEDVPRVACPTCATTYSMRSGRHGPPLKRTGLQGFVGNLAKTATANEASRDAKVYTITRDEQDGKVYCR